MACEVVQLKAQREREREREMQEWPVMGPFTSNGVSELSPARLFQHVWICKSELIGGQL